MHWDRYGLVANKLHIPEIEVNCKKDETESKINFEQTRHFTNVTYNTSLLSPGPSLGAPLAAGVSPYPAYNLASVGGVDWSALGYSLPGPAMYATL